MRSGCFRVQRGRRRRTYRARGVDLIRNQWGKAYATTEEARSAVCFIGVNAISDVPITTKVATPKSSRRAITFRYACTPITVACAKLDHAVNAIGFCVRTGCGMQRARIYRELCKDSSSLPTPGLASPSGSTDKRQRKTAIQPTQAQLSMPVLGSCCPPTNQWILPTFGQGFTEVRLISERTHSPGGTLSAMAMFHQLTAASCTQVTSTMVHRPSGKKE